MFYRLRLMYRFTARKCKVSDVGTFFLVLYVYYFIFLYTILGALNLLRISHGICYNRHIQNKAHVGI